MPASLTRSVRSPVARRVRRGLLASSVALGVLTTVGAPQAHAASGVDITGGDATADVVCGNVAAAQSYARSRHLVLQRSNCDATADGANANLSGLSITMSRSALVQNRDNPVLAALADGPSFAQDFCKFHRPSTPRPGLQLNVCRGSGRGGGINAQNLTMVTHRPDGSTTSRRIDAGRLPGTDRGSAAASCFPVVEAGINQRDDCTTSAGGGSWVLHGVRVGDSGDVVDVNLHGGNARASIHCFNVSDGSGHVIQINNCRATATGGDVVLRDVTIHVFS